jgi:hypothetical protein
MRETQEMVALALVLVLVSETYRHHRHRFAATCSALSHPIDTRCCSSERASPTVALETEAAAVVVWWYGFCPAFGQRFASVTFPCASRGCELIRRYLQVRTLKWAPCSPRWTCFSFAPTTSSAGAFGRQSILPSPRVVVVMLTPWRTTSSLWCRGVLQRRTRTSGRCKRATKLKKVTCAGSGRNLSKTSNRAYFLNCCTTAITHRHYLTRHSPPTLPQPSQPTNITSTADTHQHYLNRNTNSTTTTTTTAITTITNAIIANIPANIHHNFAIINNHIVCTIATTCTCATATHRPE